MSTEERGDAEGTATEEGEGVRSWDGVRRALALFVVLGVAALIPYATPALEAFRPWTEDSPVPFTRFLDFRPPIREGIGGIQERQAASEGDDDELLAAAPLPEAVDVEEGDAEEEARGVDPELRIPREDYAGMTRPIEDPDGAMHHFYGRLLALAEGEDTIARVLMYSDSINGSDRVSQALRHSLQERFGDAGKGFVPIAQGWQYQRHKDVDWTHDGWRVWVVNRGELDDGRYGIGGVLAENRSRFSESTFGTSNEGPAGRRVGLFRLFYQAFPRGSDVTLTVDGGAEHVVPTASGTVEDRVHEIEVEDGAHELTVGLADEERVHLYGVVMERRRPGIVVDGLMLVGAFTRVLLNFDPEHWARQMRLREPDLIAFWLGGNDSVSDSVGFLPDRFVEEFTQVLDNAQAGRPEASCLVISVLDSAEHEGGVVRSRRRVPRVVRAQREAARNAGCAFFDGYEAIGGRNTMYRWYHHRPRLVTGDYRHLTRAGARVVGGLIEKALLRGYDAWLVETAGGTREPVEVDGDARSEPEDESEPGSGSESGT